MRLLIQILAILFLSFPVLAGPRISIYISPPRGGFGDTAANLMMIERLQKKFEVQKKELQVIYSDSSAPQIKKLWPEFKLGQAYQKLRGIRFYNALALPNESDIVLSFSIGLGHAENMPAYISSKKQLHYLEYHEMSEDVDDAFETPLLFPLNHQPKTITHLQLSRFDTSAILNTGGEMGLYTWPEFRTEDSDKSKTLELIFQKIKGIKNYPDLILAYAYNPSSLIAKKYQVAIEAYAEKHHRHILLFSNHEHASRSSFVQVVNFNGIHFDLNQKILKSADLPVLVTGDSSLSLAIEGNQPYFYVLYIWKLYNSIQISELIKKHSIYFSTHPKEFDYVTRMMSLSMAAHNFEENDFLYLFENKELQQELSRVLKIIAHKYSLVDQIPKDIEMIQRAELPELDRQAFLYLWDLYRKSESKEQLKTQLIENVFSLNLSHTENLLSFRAYWLLEKENKQNVAQVLSEWIKFMDARMSLILSYYIQVNYTDAYQNLFPYLSSQAKNFIIESLQNHAHQPADQWLEDKIRNSREALWRLRAQQFEQNQCRELLNKPNVPK